MYEARRKVVGKLAASFCHALALRHPGEQGIDGGTHRRTTSGNIGQHGNERLGSDAYRMKELREIAERALRLSQCSASGVELIATERIGAGFWGRLPALHGGH